MDSGDRKLLGWWLLLVALTVLSFESGLARLDNLRLGAAIVIVIALVKIRVVMQHFMEVATAPWKLRAPLDCWLVLIGVALLGFWYA